MTTKAPSAWSNGYRLILIVPFIGMALTFLHPPTWLQILGVVAMLVLVFFGTRLMKQRRGAWRPSDTLPKP